MNDRVKTSALALTLFATLGAGTASAADARPTEGLRAGIARARTLLLEYRDGKRVRTEPAARPVDVNRDESLAIVDLRKFPLVGTWAIEVPGPTPADTFYAYQTFNSDGTFVETSSLLGALVEGPAHGSWRSTGASFAALTFELFAFDAGAPVGRVRVRATITVDAPTLVADTAVDILDLEGNLLEEAVATGPFTGRLVPVRPR